MSETLHQTETHWPVDVLNTVFDWLVTMASSDHDAQDDNRLGLVLFKCYAASRTWNAAAAENERWERIYLAEFGAAEAGIELPTGRADDLEPGIWRRLYLCRRFRCLGFGCVYQAQLWSKPVGRRYCWFRFQADKFHAFEGKVLLVASEEPFPNSNPTDELSDVCWNSNQQLTSWMGRWVLEQSGHTVNLRFPHSEDCPFSSPSLGDAPVCQLQILSVAHLELWGRLRQSGRQLAGVGTRLIRGGRLEARQQNCISYGLLSDCYSKGADLAPPEQQMSLAEELPLSEMLTLPVKRSKQRNRSKARQQSSTFSLGQQSLSLNSSASSSRGAAFRGEAHREGIASLQAMGFDQQQACWAMEMANGDVAAAASALIQ
eukprot:TRINITY_DN4644_c0_g1_i2.p1 TRINITY_DN4644_c0_g1~~TRINITY_DN4644_c0_g1_i2.p1  ORF type:complete len:374 (+),score=75.65 TRINITY_DN4644_c0_g1_i2:198-1319(+)